MRLRWAVIGGIVIFGALVWMKISLPRFGASSDQKDATNSSLHEGAVREGGSSLNAQQPPEKQAMAEGQDDLTFFRELKKEEATVGLEVKQEAPPPSPVPSMKPAPSLPLPYTIQVGSFNDQIAARKLAARLSGKGYPSYVVSALLPDKNVRFRVRVGHYSTREEAVQVARRLRTEEKISFFIVKETAPTQ